MPPVTLLNWNLRAAITNRPEINVHLKHVVIPDIPMRVNVDLAQQDYLLIDRDPLLNQILRETCQEAFVQVIRSQILPLLQQLDQQCASMDLEQYALLRQQTLTQIRSHIASAAQKAKPALTARIERLEMEKKQYKGYRKKVAINTVTTVASAVAAGAGLAGAVGTGGATLAISVIAGYRTVMGGFKLIVDSWQEALTVQKRVEDGLRSLKATYAAGKSRGVAREVGLSAFNAVTKLPIASSSMANLTTISGDNELWKGKLTHLRFLAHELSEKLNELLKNTEELSRQMSIHLDMKDKTGKLDEINKLLTEGYRYPTMKRKLTIQKAHQEAESGLKAQEKVEELIEELKSGRSGWVDRWDTIINVVVDLSLTAAGYGLTTAPSAAADYIGLVAGVPTDAYGVCNSLYEVGEAMGANEKIAELAKRKSDEEMKTLTTPKSWTAATPTPQKPGGSRITLGSQRVPTPAPPPRPPRS